MRAPSADDDEQARIPGLGSPLSRRTQHRVDGRPTASSRSACCSARNSARRDGADNAVLSMAAVTVVIFTDKALMAAVARASST